MSTSERFQVFREEYLSKAPAADFKQISAAWRAHERGEELPIAPSTKLPVTLVPGEKKGSRSPIGSKLPVIIGERKRSPSPVKKSCGETKFTSAELLGVVEQQITELTENRRQKMVVGHCRVNLENALTIVCERSGDGYRLERYYYGIDTSSKPPYIVVTKQTDQLTLVDVRAVILTYLNYGLKSKDVYVNQALAVSVLDHRPGCGIDERFALLRVMFLDDLNTILAGNTDALKWLGTGASPVLAEITRARLMLYLWVRLAHEPETLGQREIIDTRDAFKRIYKTQLRGGV